MEDRINIKALTLTDPAKREKGTGFKKAKKISEEKIFEGGKKGKNLMEVNKKNKEIIHKRK